MRPITILEVFPILEELQKVSKYERVEFFRDPDNFFLFWLYHFPQNFSCDLADFHFDWMNTITLTNLSVMIEAMRGSLKTEIVKVYITYCICYAIEPFIVVQSYDSSGSEEMVRNISKMITTLSITTDYGNLFPYGGSKADMAKKSITNFDTTNGVKIVSRSLGEKLRGASSFDEEEGSDRPTLLILDDIDVIDSVRNIDIINKNYQKITNETIGAMSKERSRIIFLGNTILGDGIVRRFAKEKANSPYWKLFKQPLFNEDGKVAWDFFTPDLIEKIKSDEGPEAFSQNYLLIPKTLAGMPVFESIYINRLQKQELLREINGIKFYLDPCDELIIGVDLAEGGEDGDESAFSGRRRDGKVAFTYKDKVDESILAEKLDFVLNFTKNGRKYQGLIFPENNTGKAFINECKKYPWFKYMLKSRNLDKASGDNLQQKFGFRTTMQSKDLIIREYKIGIFGRQIWVTDDIETQINTYQYDKFNRPNALSPDKDDLLMADMIAYNGVLHEDWVVKYKLPKEEEEDLGHLQRMKLRISRGDYQDHIKIN